MPKRHSRLDLEELPSPVICVNRTELTEDLDAAALLHAGLADLLISQAPTAEPDVFNSIFERCRSAKKKYDVAREAFRQHCVEHRCKESGMLSSK